MYQQEIEDMVGCLCSNYRSGAEFLGRKDVVVNWPVYEGLAIDLFTQHLEEMHRKAKEAKDGVQGV